MGVVFATGIPGFAGSERIRLEENVPPRDRADHVSDADVTKTMVPSVVRASVDFVDIYGARMLAGRTFLASDVGPPTS